MTRRRGSPVELDARTKQLLRELGRAINHAVSESDEIAQAISRVKANGYDVFLMLDAVVGLNKREVGLQEISLTRQDRRFLKSLKIRLDAAGPNGQGATETQMTITPQDLKFLRSLRISVDDIS